MLIVNGQFEPCTVSWFYLIKHNSVCIKLFFFVAHTSSEVLHYDSFNF